MGTIYNCDQSELVELASKELKKVESIKQPDWAIFVKTGMSKERPPENKYWWQIRAASVLRQIYLKGPVGVSKLRTRYGGRKNRGVRPSKFYKGSGNLLRKILQQLEAAGFVKKEEKAVHRGRVITAEGKKLLDSIAVQISIDITKKVVKKPEAKKEQTKESKSPEKKSKEKDVKSIEKNVPKEKSKKTETTKSVEKIPKKEKNIPKEEKKETKSEEKSKTETEVAEKPKKESIPEAQAKNG